MARTRIIKASAFVRITHHQANNEADILQSGFVVCSRQRAQPHR